MNPMPYEFAIAGVYFPPLLMATLLGFFAALATANLLNRYRLAKYFFYPQLVFLEMVIIYTVLFGTFVIKG